MNEYSLTPEKKKRLNEIIAELNEFCLDEDIPFFFSAAIENTAKKTKYINKIRSPYLSQRKLCNDTITKHLSIANGAKISVLTDYQEEQTCEKETVILSEITENTRPFKVDEYVEDTSIYD